MHATILSCLSIYPKLLYDEIIVMHPLSLISRHYDEII